jgi:hypothetical protein
VGWQLVTNISGQSVVPVPKGQAYSSPDGFGGLVVRMLASGSRVRGFKPGRSRWIFLYIKILSMPSFGGEVK